MSYLSDFLGASYKDGMTEEEISIAMQNKISAMNENHKTEVSGLKASISKSNSEAADYKKQLRAKQTEEEQKEADRQAEWEKILNRNKELERTIATSELSSKLVSQGYSPELATETATAMLDGDFESVLKNQKSFIESREKSLKAGIMQNTPHPSSGSESGQNYQQMIEKANADGNYAEAAYYTRLSQMK